MAVGVEPGRAPGAGRLYADMHLSWNPVACPTPEPIPGCERYAEPIASQRPLFSDRNSASIKGWIQTVALSFGRGVPDHLKLPLAQRLAMHGVLTGGVLGLLFYPAAFWLVAVAISAALTGNWPASPLTLALLIINLGNLFVVLLAAAVSSLRGLAAARLLKLVWCIPLLPIYWALMSLAAWQALFQFFRNPSAWEKTTHGVARKRRAPRRIAF